MYEVLGIILWLRLWSISTPCIVNDHGRSWAYSRSRSDYQCSKITETLPSQGCFGNHIARAEPSRHFSFLTLSHPIGGSMITEWDTRLRFLQIALSYIGAIIKLSSPRRAQPICTIWVIIYTCYTSYLGGVRHYNRISGEKVIQPTQRIHWEPYEVDVWINRVPPLRRHSQLSTLTL